MEGRQGLPDRIGEGLPAGALGRPLAFNTPSGQAFGVLASAPGIHAAAVERLADRARDVLGG